MQFIKDWLRNLVLIILFFGAIVIFTAIFYPDALIIFYGIGLLYNGANLWPIFILGLIIATTPKRKRKR